MVICILSFTWYYNCNWFSIHVLYCLCVHYNTCILIYMYVYTCLCTLSSFCNLLSWTILVLSFLHRLIVAARTASKLEETVQSCREVSSDVYPVVADVSKKEDCEAIIDSAVKNLGGVDILILNAAFSYQPKWFSDINNPVSRRISIFYC